MPDVEQWPDDQGGEQVADFVAGERDLAVGRRSAGALGGGGDGQERGGEHGQGDPAVPGVPAADLMLVQAGQSLAGLEVVLHRPPPAGDPGECGEGDVAGCVAAVEGQFPGPAAAADQQPAVPGPAGVDADECPVAGPVALGAPAGGIPLPR